MKKCRIKKTSVLGEHRTGCYKHASLINLMTIFADVFNDELIYSEKGPTKEKHLKTENEKKSRSRKVKSR